MYFFTSDEHYGHKNIIKYCNRPYEKVEEMDQDIIDKHNAVVGEKDTVVHAGDFTLANKEYAGKCIEQLNGSHVFLQGSHDSWLGKKHPLQIWEKKIEGQKVVVCHYAMRTWPTSHYNTWQLYGHSHGMLLPVGKQWDIGVDNNKFYPVSFEQLKQIMKQRPDNVNLVMEEGR
ncbi:MAG: phosphoesterase [bacterium]|nr:phosphoesterase [bacterium]